MSAPRFDKALELINQMASDLGVFPTKQKSAYIYYTPPKDWDKTIYYFAYTPWRTIDPETGKEGFWTLKYRVLKNGNLKLVKKIRFGRRKIASRRALQWYEKYYEAEEESQ